MLAMVSLLLSSRRKMT
ncbi:hypothetical protein LINGRAHAP2_LOCUS7166 [Linum grandiflorum]